MSKIEIPVVSDDLDALMAELEAEMAATGGVPVEAPVESKLMPPVADPADAELDVLAAEAAAEAPVVPVEALKPSEDPVAPVGTEAPSVVKRVRRPALAAVPPAPPPITPEMQAAIDTHSATVAESVFSPAELVEATATVTVTPKEEKGAVLAYYIDVEKFRADTAVSETSLDQCMIQQSGQRAYYGAQAAFAKAQASRMAARFDVLEAKLSDEHRKRLATTGEKVTEKMVEAAVLLDPRWMQAKNAVIESETIAAVNRALVDSMSDRKDMLVQLGADRREEFKGAVRIVGGTDAATVNKAESAAKAALASRQSA